jgi:hypothetical protein
VVGSDKEASLESSSKGNKLQVCEAETWDFLKHENTEQMKKPIWKEDREGYKLPLFHYAG